MSTNEIRPLKISCAGGSTLTLAQSGQIITLTTSKDICATYKVEDEIYYLKLDDSARAKVTITRDGQKVLAGEMEMGGVFSYRPETGTFGLTGANSSHGDGTNTYLQFAIEGQKSTSRLETNDTTIVFIPTLTGDKYEINFPNERKHAMKLTITRDGQTIFENKIAIDGVVGLGTNTQELSLNKGTVLTLTQGDNVMEITALEEAGGQISFIEGGIRFAPNSDDGALELNFVTTERKANLNITGAIILGEEGKITLEDGTQINLDWEDGTNLKMTSHGSNGSIGLSEKGIQITSEDEKLDIDLTLPSGVQTHLSGIKGTIYYNAGKVSFEENAKITATTTLGGQPILITLETIGGTGYLDFNTNNGVKYSTDTGAMKITWSRDDLESTFTVNSGSIQIGHGLFQISEGTDLATDLKNFVPALYFTTSEAGTYTINGQTITTSAANLAMTATDDYMTFTTSDDVVTYDGMTFAGAGKVSLTANSVVLGAGVEAEGFGKDKSFVLAQAGNVTADARIFELAEEVPTGLTVTGAQDGFIFSRTTTQESESRFSNPNPDNVGKIFTEKFIAAGDSSYRIQTDLLGLQQIIGISGDTTILGSASFDGEPEETVFDIVTNSEGVFTVGEKKYIISGDSSVAIMADFEPDKSYVRGFKDLSGIASGDFNEHAVTVNGGIPISVKGGKIVDIVADENGQEVFGIRDGESLVASLAGNYTVDIRAIELIEDVPKGITIEGTAGGDFKIGSTSDSGEVLVENFSATGGDYAYSLQISTLGLEKVLGVSDGTTIKGGADIDGETIEQEFDIITKTEGAFTFGERTYSISGDSSVSITAAFNLDEGYAYSFDGLSGTVSGNFNDSDFSVNGGESILINGDSSIDLVAGANGIELFNVSGGASLIEMGGVSKVHTDTEGTFTFGNGGGDTVAITIQGDDNITFELNDAQFVAGITNIEGDIFFSETNASLSINGISGTFSGEFSSIGAYSSALYIHDITDGSGLVTSDEDKIWLQLRGGSFALNDNGLTLTNDADGIWLREKEVVGLDEGASLQVGEAGTYTVNETVLSAKADDIIVGLKDSAYIYDPNNPLITKNTPTAEIIQQITGGDSSINTVVASGRENLSLKGGDLAVVENTPAQVSITASKGNDTIASKGENVHIKLNGTGKTDLFALDGRITLEGYSDATGTGFGTNYSDILTAINNDAIDFDKGKLTIDSAVVTFDKDSELINFYDAAGELQKVGYASDDSKLDASKQKADLILFAEKYSTLEGGSGSDTIFADAGSYVDAGAGKNYIEIKERSANADGTTIAIRNGKATVANFKAGFDDTSDRVFFGVNDAVDFKFDGNDLKVYNGNEMRGVLSNVASGADFVNILTADNNSAPKVAVAQENAVIAVENEIADLYVGEKSGVDFTNYAENLFVNLGSENLSIGGGEILFSGINQVTVGGGLNTLISSSRNETLTGNGTTEYIFDKDSGRDVLTNFNFDDDKINVGTNAVTDVRINNAGGVRMEIGGSAVLTLADAQGKNFKINNLVAKADKNLTYDDEANYFVATTQNATLSVGADISDAKIWLDGSQGKTFVGDIRTLDASNSTVKAELAGNDLDNKIFAGKGDASLWGGNGGNDLLVGGAGKNTFYYTTGNGSDTISGANAGDVVYLTQVSLDQISGASVTNNIATINFVDGGQLTINDAANCNFVLTQGDQSQTYGVSGNSFVAK